MAVRVEVDGVELTVVQVAHAVTISRVVGRDRTKSRPIAVRSSVTFDLASCGDPPAIALVHYLRKVAAYPVEPCRCDYRYGHSDHAAHCRSIYVAREFRGEDD